MKARARLLDEATTPAEKVIAQAASVAPHALRDDWDEVMALAVMARPGAWRHLPAFLLSFAFGVALVLLVRPAPVAPPTTIAVVTPGSRWSSTTPDEVLLQSGRLSVTAPSAAPLRVRTPDAVLEVSRSKFLAEVVSGGTTLWVEEGEVVLRSGDVMRVVHAGESLTWPPAPVIPAPLLAVALTESHCTSLPHAGVRDCLRREAAGASLEAQAALYELGAFEANRGELDAALHAWHESLERFPDGVLHPEVRLAVVIALVKARRFTEANDAAADFEVHCSTDPRLGDLLSLRRALRTP